MGTKLLALKFDIKGQFSLKKKILLTFIFFQTCILHLEVVSFAFAAYKESQWA